MSMKSHLNALSDKFCGLHFQRLFAIKTLWFKIQGQFASGGTTFSEFPHGGITLSELAWRAHWTKLAILNQHARGGITQYKKITQPLNEN